MISLIFMCNELGYREAKKKNRMLLYTLLVLTTLVNGRLFTSRI